MLAAATSFFARTAISQSYNIGASNLTRSDSPSPSGSSSPAPQSVAVPPFNVGLWRVQSATHKTSSKRVSVWSFDKRSPEIDRLGAAAKDRTFEVLKAEASALGRLRHPSILEMVEPMEETRAELIFATEPVISPLQLSIPAVPRVAPLVELDEVEIQKGILQLCKGLQFLHSSARLIHSNIKPETIIINTAGDWKIAGLGLTIPLNSPDGGPTRWEFPTFDGRVPDYIQRSFDYMAPEYALDEVLIPASDIYSLGILIYAVHCKGQPPFKNHGSLGGIRDNAGRSIPGMQSLDTDLQALLRTTITRGSQERPTPTTLPSYPFFNSLPISTLNFLDRSNFSTKSREEKISFMKGLTGVLDKFSEGLRTRKLLPTLVEEMKDVHLLPYILPNVFAISTSLTISHFSSLVLPSLKPLFNIKDPPQNMLTLLDNLGTLQSKTEKGVFREQVLPLVYHALDSEHATVQERALSVIPDLCETVDYAEVSNVIFPRVALVFTKTKILSVKIASLETFLVMVKTLDQTNLTQKLVPLLSKIRTKEPGVMMATLAVQEAMGFKVDREAVATHVLPQLWAISMGPLLNLEQFQRFMAVIRKLGDRVEKEHDQFLRDTQRIGNKSATMTNSSNPGAASQGSVDFESLVGRSNGAVKADSVIDAVSSWDDDPWGAMLSKEPEISTPNPSSSPVPVQSQNTAIFARSLPPDIASTKNALAATRTQLVKRPDSSQSFESTALAPSSRGPMLQSVRHSPPIISSQPNQIYKPNYDITLPTATPMPSFSSSMAPPPAAPILMTSVSPNMMQYNPARQTLNPMPMQGAGILAPSKPPQKSGLSRPADNAWADFDPLA